MIKRQEMDVSIGMIDMLQGISVAVDKRNHRLSSAGKACTVILCSYYYNTVVTATQKKLQAILSWKAVYCGIRNFI